MNTISSIYSPITSLYLDRFIEVTEKQNEYGYIFLSKKRKRKRKRKEREEERCIERYVSDRDGAISRGIIFFETMCVRHHWYLLRICIGK